MKNKGKLSSSSGLRVYDNETFLTLHLLLGPLSHGTLVRASVTPSTWVGGSSSLGGGRAWRRRVKLWCRGRRQPAVGGGRQIEEQKKKKSFEKSVILVENPHSCVFFGHI